MPGKCAQNMEIVDDRNFPLFGALLAVYSHVHSDS
jgi:hypothetical protein